MRSRKPRMPQYVSWKAVALWCVLSVVGAPFAYSQGGPVPPTPRKQPVLPGTHVPPHPLPPQPVAPKIGIVLHTNSLETVD
jgi:hypothetical protein